MKAPLLKKVLLTMFGVGVVSSLMSVGTFATFTATTTNPGNTFATGTLQISDSAAGSALSTGPNITGVAAGLIGGSACTQVVAGICHNAIQTVNVAAGGMEPGQYAQSTITVTNSGSLPAIMALNVNNLLSPAVTCSTDGTTGSAIGCSGTITLGNALNIAIEDANGPGNVHQCIWGVAAALANSGAIYAVNNTSACADLVTTPPTSVQAGAGFGDATHTAGTLWGIGSTTGTAASTIFIPGKAAACAGNTVTQAGVTFCRWAAGEVHTIKVTVQLPDTGTTTATLGTNTITIGQDTKYTSGSVGFDFVWASAQ